MLFNICTSLFLTGVIMGSGPCLLSCGPILLSYIAGTKNSALQGLRCWLVFSVSRLLATLFLAFLAGFIGTALFNRFYWEISGYIIWGFTGVFIVFLGFMVFIGFHAQTRLCGILGQAIKQRHRNSTILLGILVGFLPCIPLLGVLSYIAMISTHPLHGIFMGAAFGIGVILSPLVFASMLAGALPGLRFFQNQNRIIIFQRICGLVLMFLGMHITIKTLMEIMSVR
jgi:hypothetical protein